MQCYSLFLVSSLFIWECLLFANYITNGFQRGTQAILKHLRSRIPGTLLQRISVCIWITICRNIAKVAIVEHASILETIGNALEDNRAFAWWLHLTTTTRMLWGKLLYSVLFSFVKNRSCVTQICITKIAAKCILVVVAKWRHREYVLMILATQNILKVGYCD